MSSLNASEKHTFTTPLERVPGKGGWYFLRFPHSVEHLYGTRGSVRVKATFNGLPVDRALIPHGDGSHHLIVSGEMRRKLRLAEGSPVRVELVKNENPDEVILPEELEAALDLEPGARATFNGLKAGVRRGMAHWVNSAKSPDVRARRATDMLNRILQREFVFGGEKVKI
jgi:hypothetical protein